MGASDNLSFSVTGKYRVQSRHAFMDSMLEGVWLVPRTMGCLDAQDVTHFVREHPACTDPGAEIRLAPAIVSSRSGAFAVNDDALYYSQNFVPAEEHYSLRTNVLDVTKLQDLWRERRPLLKELVQGGDFLSEMLNGDITRVAIDEYMCHEAGHLLGVPVQEKHHSGYFRLGGRFRWALVYVEEFRADANAWSLALRHLSPTRARAVIGYTLLHRLGLAAQNLRHGQPGAGYVPFLDFSVAWRSGLLAFSPDAAAIMHLNATPTVMACLEKTLHGVLDQLTTPDSAAPNNWDIAQRSMKYLDAMLRDDAAVNAFRRALSPAERVAHARPRP